MKRILASLFLLVSLLVPLGTAQADPGIRNPGTGTQGAPPTQVFLPLITSTNSTTGASTAAADAPFEVQAAPAPDDWQPVGAGISYREFVLPDPNLVYVARMDRADQAAFLESAIGSGELATGRETVSGMAARYDQAVNHWNNTWGGTNHVVVAINGDYFKPGSGYPQNGMVQSGWYSKRYNDYEGWSGFAWTTDRQAFIGQCIINPAGGQTLVFSNGKTRPIDAVNAPRSDGQVVLYTPQYGTTTFTDGGGVEAVIELTSPLRATSPGELIRGHVTAVYRDRNSTPIPYDSVVLSGQGTAGQDLADNLSVGEPVGFSQQIDSFDTNCKAPLAGDWTKAYASIGGAFTFLRDGQAQHDGAAGAIVPAPRTAILLNDQYIYFMVVDGRNPGVSAGMTFDQLAAFGRDELGAAWGIAQDGGGSSTMVINGQVVNTPSDRCQPGSPDALTDQDPTSLASASGTVNCERPVANGMMMVDYVSPSVSTAFQTGQKVVAANGAAVYLGPGTNYGVLASVPVGRSGVVARDLNGLDGIQAKGASWWKVSFGDVTGWASEADLAGQ